MQLRLFKTLWGYTGSREDAIAAAQATGFDGLEGPAPRSDEGRQSFHANLVDAGLDYIAEICTAGGYVPDQGTSPADHLETFRRDAEAALACEPLFLTVIAGSDAWSLRQSVEFFASAIESAGELGVVVCFETHRSRSMFNPWITRDLLQELPSLRLTCDFSHWCCVCERLVMDTEPEILALCMERAHHIHARVGYDQGPQVPHPAAPEFQGALEAHERWWAQLWQAHFARGFPFTTMTPEFGPDGYLQCAPFTREPVADLAEINGWMAGREREHFSQIFPPPPDSAEKAIST